MNFDIVNEDIMISSQQGFVFESYVVGKKGNVVPVTAVLKGEIDIPLLVKSVDRLRSRFYVIDKGVCSGNENTCTPKVEVFDDLSLFEKYSHDIEISPEDTHLFRFSLIKVSDDEIILRVFFHHVAGDRQSIEIFLTALIEEYFSESVTEKKTDNYLQAIKYVKSRQSNSHESRYFWQTYLSSIDFNSNAGFLQDRVESLVLREKKNISLSLLDGLYEKSKNFHVSRQVLVLAAYFIALKRVMGGSDTRIVGIPFSLRDSNVYDNTVGPFIETLPVRASTSSKKSFESIVDSLKNDLLDIYDHKYCALTDITKSLGASGISNGLFASVFSWSEAFSISRNGISVFLNPPEKYQTILDYSVIAHESNDGIELAIDYSEGAISRVEARKILCAIEDVIVSIDTYWSMSINDICKKINFTSLNHSGSIVENDGLKELFETVISNSNRTAIILGSNEYSYTELIDYIEKAGYFITEQNIYPGDTIGLCSKSSIEIISLMLGALCLGVNVALLDPNDSTQRIEQALSKTFSKVVFSEVNISHDGLCEIPCLKSFVIDKCIDVKPVSNLDLNCTSGKLVIFTSGTTGKPKPVILSPCSVIDYCKFAAYKFGISSEDRVLQICSTGFDAYLEELFVTFLSGASLVLKDDNISFSTDEFCSFCKKNQISVVDLPTGYFNLLIGEDKFTPSYLIDLKTIIIGGEALSCSSYAQYREKSKNWKLINTYGPTETTIVSAFCCLDLVLDSPEQVDIPIGIPVDNTRIYILDDQLDPVENGSVGEIFIAGSNVSTGYYQCPRDTSERFIPDLYGRNGELMFKTGDYGFYNVDGQIVYRGRNDGVVKFNSLRIDLAEYESYLHNQFNVISKAVIVILKSGEKVLGLAVQVKDELLKRDIVGAIDSHYSQSRRPQQVVFFDEIPVNLRGKTDYEMIDKIICARYIFDEKNESQTQKTSEEFLLSIVRRLLGNPDITASDCFFKKGGHSILVIRYINEIKKRYNISVPVYEIFSRKTCAKIADYIDKNRYKLDDNLVSHKSTDETFQDRVDVLTDFELSIYLSDLRCDGRSPYVIKEGFDIAGVIDLLKLKNAVSVVCEHNPILRSVVSNTQVTSWEPYSTHFAIEKIYYINACKKNEEFDLHSDFPLRVYVDQIDSDKFKVHFIAHHIAFDGYSLKKLVELISAAYVNIYETEKLLKNNKARRNLSPDQFVYNDWWSKELDGKCVFDSLPKSDGYDLDLSVEGAIGASHLPGNRLGELSELTGYGEFVVALSVSFVWLYKLTGNKNLSIFTPVLLDSDDNTQICSNITLLPVLVDFDESETFSEFIEGLQSKLIEVIENRYVKELELATLIKRFSNENYTAPPVLFDLNFGQFDTLFKLDDATVTKIEIPVHNVRGHIEISLSTNKGTVIELRGKHNRYSNETLKLWSESWGEVLESICKKGIQNQLRNISSTGNGNRLKTIFEGQLTNRKISTLDGFLNSLDRKLDSKMDLKVVSQDKSSLTGKQFLDQTRITAQGISEQLVQCSSNLVAIIFDRSIEFVVSLIGAWKAGAVVVLVDKKSPKERLKHIISLFDFALVISDKKDLLDIATVDIYDLQAKGALYQSSPSPKGSKVAYVTLTSGTTGVPKPILCTWEGLGNLLSWSIQGIPLTEEDIFIHTSSPGFDISIWEVVYPLLSGACLEILPGSMQGEVGEIIDLIDEKRVTAAHFVPSLLTPIIGAMNKGEGKSLRTIVCGGEVVPTELYRSVKEKLNVSFYHTYGPSESSIFILCWKDDGNLLPNGKLPLGDLVDNSKIMIVDKYGEPVVKGTVGELWVSGSSVSLGYYGMPRQSSLSFIPDGGGCIWYKTGDYVRQISAGSIEYVGRIDKQIKINGVRFEAYEIEVAIERFAGVAKAIVVPVEEQERKILSAYITCSDSKNGIDFRLLKESLKQRIPSGLIPRKFFVVDQFPLTVNGKIDTKALVDNVYLKLENSEIGSSKPVPGRVREKMLATLSEFLSVSELNETENFFEVGGDSITAIRLIAHLRSLGFKLTLKQVFNSKKISDLLDIICSDSMDVGLPSLIEKEDSIVSNTSSNTISIHEFVSQAARSWLNTNHSCLSDGVQHAVVLAEGVDSEKIEAALQRLVKDTPSLRHKLTLTECEWTLDILSEPVVDKLLISECNAFSLNDLNDIIDFTRNRINLVQGINLCVSKCHFESKTYLILASHHLSLDMFSWERLLELLSALCFSNDLDQYHKLVHNGTGYLASLKAVSHNSPNDIGLCVRNKCNQSVNRVSCERSLSVEVFDGVRAWAKDNGLSLDVVISYLISLYVGQRKSNVTFTVAVERSLRNTGNDSINALGWFTGFETFCYDGLSYQHIGDYIFSSDRSNSEPDIVCNLIVDNELKNYCSKIKNGSLVDKYSNFDIPPHQKLVVEIVFCGDEVTLSFNASESWLSLHSLQTVAELLVDGLGEYGANELKSSIQYPLSPLQKSILSACLRTNNSNLYNTQIIYRINGDVDLCRLKASWYQLHLDHDVFSVAFSWEDDGIYQFKSLDSSFIWEQIELESEVIENEVHALAERGSKLNLREAPLSRLTLLTSKEITYLVWSHHHILFDGWSLPLITEKISKYYSENRFGALASESKHTDYFEVLGKVLSTKCPVKIEREFVNRLVGMKKPCILGKVNSIELIHETKMWELSDQISIQILEFARSMRVTVSAVIQTAWVLALSKLTGNRDVAYGLVVSSRDSSISGFDNVIGFFLNTLPVVINISTDDTVKSLFEKVNGQIVCILENSTASLTNILSGCRKNGMDGDLFNTVVVYENYPGEKTGSNLGVDGHLDVVRSVETSEIPWVFVVIQSEDKIKFELIYHYSDNNKKISNSIESIVNGTLEKLVNK